MLLTYYTDEHHDLYIFKKKKWGLSGKEGAVKYSQNFGKSNNDEK